MFTFKHSNLISNFYETTQLTKKENNTNREIVTTITLDRYCSEKNIEHIDIMRLDVNGYELNILKGAENLLNNKKIKFIHFSFYNVNTPEQTGSLNNLSKFMEEKNYRLGYFYNDFIHPERNGGYYFATYFSKNF